MAGEALFDKATIGLFSFKEHLQERIEGNDYRFE